MIDYEVRTTVVSVDGKPTSLTYVIVKETRSREVFERGHTDVISEEVVGHGSVALEYL